jgi:GTP1/Obg family GTP-binding protein
MDLAERDMAVQKLQNLIKDKQHFLAKKNSELSQKQKDNAYLREVVGDYNVYFDAVAEEKQQQYQALQVLADYMNQIKKDPSTTEEMRRQCKYDKALILKEQHFLEKV